MEKLMTLLTTWIAKTLFCLRDIRGELTIKKAPTKTTIGKTTYLVSSFFKNDAKGTVLDKITRLIERETAAAPQK